MAKVIWKGSNVAVLGLLLAALAAPAWAQTGREPNLGDCEELEAPDGSEVAFVAYAEGVQIYRWNGTSWGFVAPEAVLYAPGGNDQGVVGIHYGGPTWESNSGSKVKAALIDRCTPDPDAIPWLLLGATSSEGPGVFYGVTFIQRLYTTGGLAPAESGDFEGDEARVPYTAWYFFYR
jgi:hypothetical protein